jgi:hypothetical protein
LRHWWQRPPQLDKSVALQLDTSKHRIKLGLRNDQWMRSGIGRVAMDNLAQIGAVAQHVEQGTAADGMTTKHLARARDPLF